MDFLLDYGLFLAKTLTFLFAFAMLLIIAKSASSKASPSKGSLQVTNLTQSYQESIATLEPFIHEDTIIKAKRKAEEKEQKTLDKTKASTMKEVIKSGKFNDARQAHLFVLEFNGSLDAKEAEALREEITAVLSVATADDEVILRLESPGGIVHGYGFAASQLDRLRDAGIHLTVAVDKVAASGGYMMACVANRIIAAPFAVIGSIGVIAQLPNFHKLLKKNNIEFEQLTAGEYKRTLTVFGENTKKAREKFQAELEETHQLFKNFIAQHRPQVDLEQVATGEHWFGRQAKSLNLIDELSTSDNLIMSACQQKKKVLSIRYIAKKSFKEKLAHSSSSAVDRLIIKWIARLQRPFT